MKRFFDMLSDAASLSQEKVGGLMLGDFF